MNIFKNKQSKLLKNTNKEFNLLNPSQVLYDSKNKNSNKSAVTLMYNKNMQMPSVNNIWSDSIYTYNKHTGKHLPILDENATNLIKSYFNMFSKQFETKIKVLKTRFRLRFRRLSVNRIFTSKVNVKHTFSDVIITVSVYNPEKLYLIKQWKQIRSLKTLSWKSKLSIKNRFYLKHNSSTLLKRSYYKEFIKNNSFLLQELKKNLRFINNILKLTFYQNNNLSNTLYGINKKYYSFYSKRVQLLKKIITKVFYNRYNYIRLLNINRNKFNSVYVDRLLPLLKNIYNKNVYLNIINLRSYFYNSEILTNLFVIKLRQRTISAGNILNKCINKLTLSNIDRNKVSNAAVKVSLLRTNNGLFLQEPSIKLEEGCFSPIINNIYVNTNKYKDYVIDSTKNTHLVGLRIEAKGRLTKRMSADRAISINGYKGSLKNIHSSYHGLSSPMIRGHERDNLQYTFKAYKTRVGSYGIKGWVSSY